MKSAKAVLGWLWNTALLVIPTIYALDGSNDPGSRAVAAAMVVIVYLHQRDQRTDKRYDQMQESLWRLEEASRRRDEY